MSGSQDLIDRTLRERFGFDRFRSLQREVIASVLEGRQTLAVMPTGAGKSLCYQLPALVLPGVTLVLSPLVALMKDQVDSLNERGIPATFINSTISERERRERARAMEGGAFRLVFLAPERFRSPRFVEVLARTPVSLFAVDEAHCISQWGHDFRPEYARVGEFRRWLGDPRTLALTATATPEVRRDVCRSLGLESPAVFVASFDRPNLFLEVVPVRTRKDRLQRLVALIAEGGCGIVYTATRRSAERLAKALAATGARAHCYHAGLSDAERRTSHELFRGQKDAVMVATCAFGMGIDRADVRFVAHAEIPRSLEAYYQEIGRAGRDGERARALLLFNHGDVFAQQRLIRLSHPGALLVGDVWERLRSAPAPSLAGLAFAVGARELEVQAALRLLEQAGHLLRLAPESAVAAVALGPGVVGDPPERAPSQRAALEAVRALLGPAQAGSFSLCEVAERSGLELEAARRALDALARGGQLQVGFAGIAGGLRVADRGTPRERLRVDLNLVRWREQRELALLRQMTRYAYAASCRRRHLLRAFGERAAACGEGCVGCDRCAPQDAPRVWPRETASGIPGDTREKTWELFRQGLTVDGVARERGLRTETVRTHLAELVATGRPVELARVVPRERIREIEQAIDESAPLLPAIKRALPPDYLWGEIQVVLASRRAAMRQELEQQRPEEPDERRREQGPKREPDREPRHPLESDGAQIRLRLSHGADGKGWEAFQGSLRARPQR